MGFKDQPVSHSPAGGEELGEDRLWEEQGQAETIICQEGLRLQQEECPEDSMAPHAHPE